MEDTVRFKIYLGSVPGNLSESDLSVVLRKQVFSFVKVAVTHNNSGDKAVKNSGYAFLTVGEYEEYLALINGEKVLKIGKRTLKASVYKRGSALRSEIAEVANKRVHIRGIPSRMDDKKLQTVLESAGLKTVLAFRAQKSSTLEKLDFGFAEFDSAELAERALEMELLRIPNTKSEYLVFERYQPKAYIKQDRALPTSIFVTNESQVPNSTKLAWVKKQSLQDDPSHVHGQHRLKKQQVVFYHSGPIKNDNRQDVYESGSGRSTPLPRTGGSDVPINKSSQKQFDFETQPSGLALQRRVNPGEPVLEQVQPGPHQPHQTKRSPCAELAAQAEETNSFRDLNRGSYINFQQAGNIAHAPRIRHSTRSWLESVKVTASKNMQGGNTTEDNLRFNLAGKVSVYTHRHGRFLTDSLVSLTRALLTDLLTRIST